MKPLFSNRSDNNRWDIKSSISAIVVAAIAGVVSIWSLNFFFSAITAIVAIIWKPGLIYRNNHPPFLLNCYLYALQTYRTHSSKLRLLLVLIILLWLCKQFAIGADRFSCHVKNWFKISDDQKRLSSLVLVLLVAFFSLSLFFLLSRLKETLLGSSKSSHLKCNKNKFTIDSDSWKHPSVYQKIY